jgi:predicted RNA polymerase sigma factor
LKPSSVIKLNLAIIIGKRDGPEEAIRYLNELKKHKTLANYYLLYASLGEYYFQSSRNDKALENFAIAKKLAKSPATKELLERKMGKCLNTP